MSVYANERLFNMINGETITPEMAKEYMPESFKELYYVDVIPIEELVDTNIVNIEDKLIKLNVAFRISNNLATFEGYREKYFSSQQTLMEVFTRTLKENVCGSICRYWTWGNPIHKIIRDDIKFRVIEE